LHLGQSPRLRRSRGQASSGQTSTPTDLYLAVRAGTYTVLRPTFRPVSLGQPEEQQQSLFRDGFFRRFNTSHRSAVWGAG
jgi:hypothetical protein